MEHDMPELVVSDVDNAVLDYLRQRACLHGRTPSQEAAAILADAARGAGSGPWAAVDAIYDRLASSGRTFSDSADLLREDRDR
jgi:plasmid stability protein